MALGCHEPTYPDLQMAILVEHGSILAPRFVGGVAYSFGTR